ncbi:MAG: restriction endonuclease subunit S [Roseburia sp.]|nr:restriction endonuclease subunit S [Roseburia sp.]MCM1098821.1 restriction endonuclease subunit S [Ruminococcus flavefaciens]MCM1225526.1 restriction endonuclease subunit S [Lachnospiraceae bacterium]
MISLSNDEAYKKLLERLKIKIVSITEVVDNSDFRIEAEYYNASKASFKSVKGSEVEVFSQYGTSKGLNEDGNGYPVLRLNEFDSFFIHAPAKYCDLIDVDTYESLKLKKNDVLICRTNGNPRYVGKAALVPQDYEYAFASYLYRIRPDEKLINSATLVAYLNSVYGRAEIERLSMVGNQANFSPAKFRHIEIPVLGPAFQKLICSTVETAFTRLNDARVQYENASVQLSAGMEFDKWKLSASGVSVRTFKDISEAGRIDAEYYQPKYDELLARIRNLGKSTIKTKCNIHDKNFNPEKTVEYKYIELANIGTAGEICGCTIAPGYELPSRARRMVHKGNIIISSIEGSLQSCALITDEYDGALCSTGFFVLDSDEINSETMLVLFKSDPVQALLKQQCTGTVLTAFSKDGLMSIPIPDISDDLQAEIKSSVKESFRLRQSSKNLLEAAKCAIELAIEQDEDKAIAYLKERME